MRPRLRSAADAARAPRGSDPASPVALVALGLSGTCAFLNLYASQPLLPLLERLFGATKAQAAWTVSAPTIAVALASPFVGGLADRIGRRRLIVLSLFALAVPTGLAATARSIPQLVAWRFAQGLVVPGIYAVAVAFVGDTWRAGGVGRAMAALVTGNVIGGFSGRFLAGMSAAALGWRSAFVLLALVTVAGAIGCARWLPQEQSRAPGAAGAPGALRVLARQLDGRLIATFAVGFNVLFAQVATFTYVTFYLADPPFLLGTRAISSLFVVYLVGAVVTPFAGRWIDRVGARRVLATALGSALVGCGLTLVPALGAIVCGLVLCCTAVFVSQSAATSFLQTAASDEVRSAAAGIYVSSYYLGGSVGGVLPALAWHAGGWPGCVALVAVVQLVTMGVALRFWHGRPRAARARPPLPSRG